MKKLLVLALALLISGCSGVPSGVAVVNLTDATAAPTVYVAPTQTEVFVAAWVLFGTPTPNGQATVVPPTSVPVTEVASAPTATVPATATLPPTATTAASTGGTMPEHGSSGDAVAGQRVFTGIGGCSSCHDVTSGMTIVGPTMKGIAVIAATRKEGMSAEDYLHESIVDPNKFVVKGFTQGLMPQTFKQTLSAKQISDVVAYLMTLK
jgi:cytochrome c